MEFACRLFVIYVLKNINLNRLAQVEGAQHKKQFAVSLPLQPQSQSKEAKRAMLGALAGI